MEGEVRLAPGVRDCPHQCLLEFGVGDILIEEILDIVLHRIGGPLFIATAGDNLVEVRDAGAD